MKGFIEVHEKKGDLKYLIALEQIVLQKAYNCSLVINNERVFIKETYEEIKELIEQAQ